jgi:hypothetical protein
MVNYKGKKCLYRPNIICQEGYCEDCQIKKEYTAPYKKEPSRPSGQNNVL